MICLSIIANTFFFHSDSFSQLWLFVAGMTLYINIQWQLMQLEEKHRWLEEQVHRIKDPKWQSFYRDMEALQKYIEKKEREESTENKDGQ